MFIFACHLIDLVVSLLGRPDRIVPFERQTRSDVEMCDNGLIVFEYPRTTVTIRTASLEVEGYQRRQLVVCGDQGTIDIQPLETVYIRPPQPLKAPTRPVPGSRFFQEGLSGSQLPASSGTIRRPTD